MEGTEFYKKNMEALKIRDEELYQAVLDYPQTEEKVYYPEKVQAKDGTEITRLQVEGKTWYLNSQYRPLQEAVTFAEQYHNVLDYSFMVFLGLGNGILARQLLKSMEEHVSFLFYEPSAEIFIHTLLYYDISDLLGNENVQLAVEGLEQEKVRSALHSVIDVKNYKLACYDALPKYRQLFPDAYEWLKGEYCDAVYKIKAYLDTEQFLGKSMASNAVQNMKYLLNCNYRDDFKGVFPVDIPAIVVAAGPSLEKNVQVLKEMKGKAFIVAVDTALPYLVQQGIRPDLAVTVDARKPLHLFQDERVKTLYLATDISGSSQALDLLSGQKVIFSGGNYVYFKDVFKIAGRELTFLKNGGSVATVAFSLLKDWGFQRIVLVGQDLALAKDKVHAGDDNIDLYKLNVRHLATEGYYGGTVYATWDFDAYRRWYEEEIAKEDTLEIINATEGGARIKGAIQMALQEVLDTYCDKEFDFEKAIQDVPVMFSKEDRPKLLDMWNGSVKNLNQLKRRFKEGIRLVEEEMRLIQQGAYSKGKMKNLHKRIGKLLEECEQYTEIQLVDSMVSDEEAKILDDIYEMEPSGDAEHCRLLEKLIKYMMAMQNAVEETRELFNGMIEEITVEEYVYGEGNKESL